jgi:hypothetical protein
MSWYSQMCHGKERAWVRDRIITEQWEIWPHKNQFYNIWDSPKDNSNRYFGDQKYAQHQECRYTYNASRWFEYWWCDLCSYQRSMRK